MNDEQNKVKNSSSNCFDAKRIFEFLPRAFWVEEVDHVLHHVMSKQEATKLIELRRLELF